jgi:VanZ family protein
MIRNASKAWRIAIDVVPAVLYVAALFYGGSIPLAAPRVDLGLPFDKVMHTVAFGGLHVMLVRAARSLLPSLTFTRQNVAAAVSASGLGALLELYQATLPHRSAELLDWVADSLGVLLAAVLVQLPLRRLFAASGPTAQADSR